MNMRWIKHLIVTLLFVTISVGTVAAAEPESTGQLKDKTVKTLMRFAFSLMPAVYTGPDGKKITIDKEKNQKAVLIPVNDAKRIVVVGYRSARAQNCDLKVMQTLNHNAMVKYEEVFKEWTIQQKLFINQLHLFTVLYLTGNVKVEETDESKKKIEARKDPKNNNLEAQKFNCSEEERKQVAASIDKYLENVKKAISDELTRRKKLTGTEKKNEVAKKAQN